jgi:hypothetical protein
MIQISIPARVCSDFEGYSFFNETILQLKETICEDIVFDFSQNTWFEANLCAIMGAVINVVQEKLNNVRLQNINPNTDKILRKNQFLASFGDYPIPDKYDTTIKYRRNRLTEEKLIKEFLFNELLSKHDFPKLSSVAQKEIVRSIFEIYSNAIIHGNCEYVYSCGQYYPNKPQPSLDFTIVDLGNTIKSNVNNFTGLCFSGMEALEWAVAENNTTKPKHANIPGGLGFKLIRDFIMINKGKIQIISAEGFWELKKGEFTSRTFRSEFPGTIVNLEFNLDDKAYYSLKTEKVEDIIF